MIRKAILSLIPAAALALPASAAYEDVGVGARVVGMGNAYTAVADDVYAVYYNPAGLATLDRPQLATTYSRLFTGLSDNSNLQNSFLAYEKPIHYGRQGTWGMYWNYFSLDDLYSEMTFAGSYGRRIFAEQLPNGLYAGTTFKILRRSLGNFAAANQAFSNTGQANQGEDPVLKKGSKSNFDADIGLLYRVKPQFQVGLAVQHLLEPNIAFADNDTDRLGRNVKLGAAYRTPWTTFAGDLDFLAAPDGSKDKIFTLAAEKWLPTLLHGTFGVRGSVGMGSRSYRQFTSGLSYKIYKMQFDYGFAIPLGTVSGTFGNHRLGLSFNFGQALGAEPTFASSILENMREIAEIGTPEFRAQAEDLALYKRTALREFLRQARLDTGEGRFAAAQQKVFQALSLNPKDKGMQDSHDRLRMVAQVFPEVRDFRTDAGEAALYEGVMEFLAGKEQTSLRKLTYAQSLQPADTRFEELLRAVEQKSGIVREPAVEFSGRTTAAATEGREKIVGASMALMEVALREQDWAKVVRLADEVLELDANSALAHKRQATAYYAQKDYVKSLKSLRQAYKFEVEDSSKRRLKSYINAMVSLIEKQRDRKAPLEPRTTGEETRVEPARKYTPDDVRRLYEAGVDLYAQGRLGEALQKFDRILELEPNNASARRAKLRVQAEILRGQDRDR